MILKSTLIVGLMCSFLVHSQDLEVSYLYAGLGSNMGSDFPVFKVSKGQFSYTREVNSGWADMEYPPADTILTGEMSEESLEKLELILNQYGDTSIYESNVLVMSGGVHYIKLASADKLIDIQLHNGWHSIAQKIVDQLNSNIPDDIPQLWLSDEKWGSEYAEKRVYELMDSMRVAPQDEKLKYIAEYPHYRFQNLSHTGYNEFAFDYIYAFYWMFFNAVNADQERLLKDWAYITARGLKLRLERDKDPAEEMQWLNKEFRIRAEDLSTEKKELALQFWHDMTLL